MVHPPFALFEPQKHSLVKLCIISLFHNLCFSYSVAVLGQGAKVAGGV